MEILVRRIGPTHLLLINAVFLELCVICVGVLHRWSRGGQAEAPVGGGILSGIRVVFQSPFLLALCGYILLLTTTAAFLYFAQARIVAQASVDSKIRTLFFARIDLVVNVTTTGAGCGERDGPGGRSGRGRTCRVSTLCYGRLQPPQRQRRRRNHQQRRHLREDHSPGTTSAHGHCLPGRSGHRTGA